MEELNAIITAATAAIAIAVPLSAVATLRVGLGGRIRTMTYYEKRLSLMTPILRDHRGSVSGQHIAALEAEIEFMAEDLVATSPRFEAERVLDWRNQAAWKRYLKLPEPTSVAGWVAYTGFYLYSVLGACSLLLGGVWLQVLAVGREDGGMPIYMLFVVAGACLGIAGVSRRWSLSIARNRVLMDEARIVVGGARESKQGDSTRS